MIFSVLRCMVPEYIYTEYVVETVTIEKHSNFLIFSS